ncbi:hypothetical protein [Glycomyces sp. MUSA5-2]|uniref:hypothetical protein n=1 Tax=Glycomyces sp. MUSA5-2 TaxID=2053002 RepID=UPI00300A47F7
METAYATAAPPQGIVPLGSTRRNGRNLEFRHQTGHEQGMLIMVALREGDDRTDLGNLIVHTAGRTEQQWWDAAGAAGIGSGGPVDHGLVRLAVALVHSIRTGETLSGQFLFKKDDLCPYVFAVAEAGLTCIS